jgi:hypothetical protein
MVEAGKPAWKALSIRQPWVDLILSGLKTIEVREWTYPPSYRGGFVIHSAKALDWKTVALFGGRRRYNYPRGAYVAIAELYDVIEIDPARNWAVLARQHRVIHPPNFGTPVFGLRLRNVVPLDRSVQGRGGPYFFPLDTKADAEITAQVGQPWEAVLTSLAMP